MWLAIHKYRHNLINNIIFYKRIITFYMQLCMHKKFIIHRVYGIYMQEMVIFIYEKVALLIYFINFANINDNYKL